MADEETAPLALTADERQALIRLLQDAVENARFSYAPRLAPLKAILAKLVPPPPPYQRPPPLPPDAGPRVRRGRRR